MKRTNKLPSFFNVILQKTGQEPIKDIAFINIKAGGEYVDGKQSKLDVLVVTITGERINAEIQYVVEITDLSKEDIIEIQKSMIYFR